MYLDRSYQPRRRRKSKIRFWPLIVIAVVAIVLYEQQPSWLTPQQLQPTPTPTRSAGSFLLEAERRIHQADFDEALTAYQAVMRLEPQNPRPLIEQSRLFLMMRDTKKARAFAEQAVELAPENADALATLARTLDWQGQYEAAIQNALDALEQDPENVYALAVLGEVYSDVRNWPVAEGYLTSAQEIDPDHPLLLRNLAYLEETRGEYEKAIEYYNQAIESAPYRFDLYIERGRQYSVGLQDYEKANESYAQAVAIYESAVTLDVLGYGVYNTGDPYQAVRELRKAVEMDPKYGLAQVHLGMALYALRNYEDAVTFLETGVILLGETARIEHIYSLGLAFIYKEPTECEKAIPWLLRALEIEPSSGPALEGLSICQRSR